jgi:tRNA pseudouridine38-40 synthase
MPRYKLTVEYDGAGFVGWQRQDNGPSVQGALEEALARLCGHRVTVTGAGRTDAGVHALGQVAHVDLQREWPPSTIRAAANFHLKPAAVAVLAAEPVAADFHARFSATTRRYRYRICNRPAPPVLDRGRAWWVPLPLDAVAMAGAARLLTGRHDFSAFRSSLCQALSPVRTLDVLDVGRIGDEVVIEASARSFLHNQVRIITGCLVEVGKGRWTAEAVLAVLASKDRARAGPTAPARGLCLVAVGYPPGGAESVKAVGGTADEEAQDEIEGDDAERRRSGNRKRGAGNEPDVGGNPDNGDKPEHLHHPGRQNLGER